MARILLGVTGGIAAYRGLELARLATQAGHGVRVVMTGAATGFVGQASFEAITGAPVIVGERDPDPMRGGFPGEPAPSHDPIGHLALAENADVMIVAPASANTIAKLAAGICDSMLTTSFLACRGPRLVAPAMNDRMYRDAATQANLETLRSRGITVIEPDEGELASRGERGVGRLPQPAALLALIEAAIGGTGPWDGLRVLVSAGGTREPLDSVRFLGNRSSGRMGVALAGEAAKLGADVTLVAANVELASAPTVRRVEVETAAELAEACAKAAATADVILMAAAVADFRPTAEAGKRSRSGGPLDLRLEPTEDVLASLAANRPAGQLVIGFAAEHGAEGIDRARAKLERKGIDAIVFNDISRAEIGFDSAQNEVTIITREGERHLAQAPKPEIAAAILAEVDALRARQRQPDAG